LVCAWRWDNNLGSVFKVGPGGIITLLHSFNGFDGQVDGNFDNLGLLIQGKDGNFYGAAPNGGPNFDPFSGYGGQGTIFKITPGAPSPCYFHSMALTATFPRPCSRTATVLSTARQQMADPRTGTVAALAPFSSWKRTAH